MISRTGDTAQQEKNVKRVHTICFTHIARSSKALGYLVLFAILALTTILVGCGSGGTNDEGTAPSGSSETTQSAPLGSEIVIGSLPTEDILPLWVAEAEGIFEELGISVTIETFQSAQELSTAVVSGAVDMAMTDIMVSATLSASGTPVAMEWITLGATPEQGRFGIMTSAESGITSLKELAGVPIGVGSCTVPEYVMDKLMEAAGVDPADIVSEEIKKLPVRYEMMSAKQVAAAALPGSFLALGEETGMVLLADDSTGQNLSQSVMIARQDLSQSNGGLAMIETVAAAWNEAAERINEAPEHYRSLLIEKALLPDPVKESYPISTYPTTQRPSVAMVNPVLDWMYEKGYLEKELTYDISTGTFAS